MRYTRLRDTLAGYGARRRHSAVGDVIVRPKPWGLVVLMACTVDGHRGPPSEDNQLIILLDDLGVDHLALYDSAATPPPTPTLDRLGREGLVFDNAYAQPVCSPSRAALISGLHSRRLGLGRIIHMQEQLEVPADTSTLADVFRHEGHRTALLGKWHLSSPASSLAEVHPMALGFQEFRGTMQNVGIAIGEGEEDLGGSYFRWEKYEGNRSFVSRTYATTDTVNDALELLEALPEPWTIVLSFHAPHAPFHHPPARLVRDYVPTGEPIDTYLEPLVALDTELGRLLEQAPDGLLDRSLVVLVGDNGTPREHVAEPLFEGRGKGTVFEGGVRVPLVVRGPGVAEGRSSALVHLVDLFPTLVEWTLGTDLSEQQWTDGISFADVLADPTLPGARQWVFVDEFSPNGAPPEWPHPVWAWPDPEMEWEGRETRAIRDRDFKLIQRLGAPHLLYDLRGRRWEDKALPLDELDLEQARALLRLSRAMQDQLVDLEPTE